MWLMQRGEIWWVNFDPSVGGEIQKQRPALILSNDTSNKYLNRVQVIPLSTRVDRLYPSEVMVTVNGRPHKAMADQLTTVSKLRLSNRLGTASMADLDQVERVVRLQLDLNP
jgi:mRNA interferase MazF